MWEGNAHSWGAPDSNLQMFEISLTFSGGVTIMILFILNLKKNILCYIHILLHRTFYKAITFMLSIISFRYIFISLFHTYIKIVSCWCGPPKRNYWLSCLFHRCYHEADQLNLMWRQLRCAEYGISINFVEDYCTNWTLSMACVKLLTANFEWLLKKM